MSESTSTEVKLPTVTTISATLIDQVTSALQVPRSVIPANNQIDHVFANLPRLIGKIPPSLRDERMIKLCLAVASGLFDSALNYIWNSTIVELRSKVRRFGVGIVSQLVNKKIDDQNLDELTDYELLQLCLELNLISEDGYFKLDQCRAMRNNYSAAHPSLGGLDEDEVIAFINRCATSALSVASVPEGVDFNQLVRALKAGRFTDEQRDFWLARIRGTHSAQRRLLAISLHGLYCDDAVGQESRLNCIDLFPAAVEAEGVPPAVLAQHQSYVGQGLTAKIAASREFFTKMRMVAYLSDDERHSIVLAACDRLVAVHNSFNNFYNEPPFAERLFEISQQGAIPESVQLKFVESVVTCAVGNQYGISHGAKHYYERMIRDFSPKELQAMLSLYGSGTLVGKRIASFRSCRARFAELIASIEEKAVPLTIKNDYDYWVSENIALNVA